MTGRFDGKVIVVTGGARGIGEAIVRRAVSEGARGVVADLGDPAAPLDGVRYVQTDVADRASVESLFTSIEAQEGGVDILVNNAGIQRVGLTETFDPAVWEQVIATHLMGRSTAVRWRFGQCAGGAADPSSRSRPWLGSSPCPVAVRIRRPRPA